MTLSPVAPPPAASPDALDEAAEPTEPTGPAEPAPPAPPTAATTGPGTTSTPAAPPADPVRRRATTALVAFAKGLPGETTRRQVLAEVITANRGVADAVAARYNRRGVPLEDLQQAAYVGLAKAVHRFDPDVADDLLTFAVPTIRGELQRYFRDHTWTVRPPRRLQELSGRVRKVADDLVQELGREPSVGELAERLDVDEDLCRQAMEASGALHATSLDRPVSAEGEGASIGDLMGEPDRLDLVEDCLSLGPAVRALSRRDRQILQLRFGDELTQAEIGEVLGVTQTQVSRLLNRILAELRQSLDDEAVDAPSGPGEEQRSQRIPGPATGTSLDDPVRSRTVRAAPSRR